MRRWFAPHYCVNDVIELECGWLRGVGVEVLLLDLDGTLKEYRLETIPQSVLEWTRHLLASGLRLCLLSNGSPRRIERSAQVIGVPFVAKAFKPLPFACRRALRLMSADASQAAVVGDQVFADVLAGRLAGLRTILVPPRHAIADEPWFTRMKRPVERWVLGRSVPAFGQQQIF